MSTVKLVSTEAALGVLGTSRFTSTQSLGWNGLSTESTLLPLVSASLGGEPAYPISELKMNIYIYTFVHEKVLESFDLENFEKADRIARLSITLAYSRMHAVFLGVPRAITLPGMSLEFHPVLLLLLLLCQTSF